MKRPTLYLLGGMVVFLLILLFAVVDLYIPMSCHITMSAHTAAAANQARIFFDTGGGFKESDSIAVPINARGEPGFFSFDLPATKILGLKIELGTIEGRYKIREMAFVGRETILIPPQDFARFFQPVQNASAIKANDAGVIVESGRGGPVFRFVGDFNTFQKKIGTIHPVFPPVAALLLLGLLIIVLGFFSGLNPRSRTYAALFLIFFISILAGLFTYRHLSLPFSNPWGITGVLTQAEYNPNNDIIRYLYFIGLPLFAMALFFVFPKIRRHLNSTEDYKNKHFDALQGFSLAVLLALAVIHIGNSYLYHYDRTPLDTFHEGETLGMAVEYQYGKIPYKETIFAHGLFEDPLRSVLAFKTLGRSISASRTLASWLGIMAQVLFLLSLYYLFDRNINYLSIMVGLLLLVNSAGYLRTAFSVPHRDIPVYLFIIIAVRMRGALTFDNPVNTYKAHLLFFLWSFIPALALADSLDRGFYLLFTSLVFLLLIFIFHFNRYRGCIPATVLGYLAGFFVLGFFIRFAYLDFFQYAFLVMPKSKELFDGLKYPFHRLEYLLPILFISANACWLLYRFITFEAGAGQSFFSQSRRFFDDHFCELALFLLAVVFFRSALGRSDLGHIHHIAAPIYISVLYVFIKRYLAPTIAYPRNHSKYVLPGLAALILLASLIAYLPGVKAARLFTFPLGIPDQALIPQNHSDLISFLRANLDRDEHFFTLTNEAAWYYFIDRPCPTRFPVVWFAEPEFYQREIVEDLRGKDVKYILYHNGHWGNRIDGIGNAERLPIVMGYIHENYAFYRNFNDNAVWMKKTISGE